MVNPTGKEEGVEGGKREEDIACEQEKRCKGERSERENSR
jgi:hypothetical protein